MELRRWDVRAMVAGAAVGLTALLVPATAWGGGLSCGDTLTQDMTLQGDLNCTGSGTDALMVGADGVDLDLNGYRVIGQTNVLSGVNVLPNFDDVTVTNGTIQGFHFAVELEDNDRVTLTDLSLQLGGTNDHLGVTATGQSELKIARVDVDNPLTGYYITNSTDLNVRHGEITGNDTSRSYGVHIFANDMTDIRGVITDVKVNGGLYGFYLEDLGTQFRVSQSVANNNDDSGFVFFENTARTVTANNNVAKRNDLHGLWASRKVVGSGNVAKDNGLKNCRRVGGCN